MTKTLYILEFSRPDYLTESYWFVASSDLDHEQQEQEALKRLELDYGTTDIAIEGIYTVPQEMIKEIYESKGN